jgi:hypothetical protein
MWRHKSLGGATLSEGIGLTPYLTINSDDQVGSKHDNALFDYNTDNYLTLNDIQIVGDKVITATPKWIKYDSIKMQEDMTDFFVTNPVIHRVTTT